MKHFLSLDKLPINSVGYVNNLNCSENIKRRLLDLGLVKNTRIIPIFNSPSGGLKAFDIRGCLIAIRDDDSSLIEIYTK